MTPPRATRRPSTPQAENETRRDDTSSRFKMQRSVAQLLFSYLPGKTVDWKDGVAIIQLQNVQLESAWEASRADLVLKEVATYVRRWTEAYGIVHPDFPDPAAEPERFTVGEPISISGYLLETALQCLSCSRLVFIDWKKRPNASEATTYRCPDPACRGPLRQFPQVFVHGCGHLVAVNKFMPSMKQEGDRWVQKDYPLICQKCGEQGIPAIDVKSERVRDLIVVCKRCKSEISRGRLNARCPACVRALVKGTLPPPVHPATDDAEPDAAAGGRADAASGDAERGMPTAITRVLMRATSYRATEAYYGHTLTILRLDRPELGYEVDAEIETLRRLVPDVSEELSTVDDLDVLARLVAEAKAAQTRGETERANELRAQVGRVARGERPAPRVMSGFVPLHSTLPDIVTGVRESLALKTKVRTRSYTEVLCAANMGATAGLMEQLVERHRALGLRPTELVEDLPVITATFGYTRRSFEATYEETSGAILPTQLRPFDVLNDYAAKRLGQSRMAGTVPILAREGVHEGIFLGLDPERVLRWLAQNGVSLPDDGRPPIARILDNCEEIDRYYDAIFDQDHPRRVRRLVFGLVHSLSHAAMRLVSQVAGLERTSLSEYLFLPRLGTVVYANNTSFSMGNMETLMRSGFYEFLERLEEKAMDCLFDPDCLDHRGACAGCIHAPEICCRAFNHGLSRAFLIGGHAPWERTSDTRPIRGYWQGE